MGEMGEKSKREEVEILKGEVESLRSSLASSRAEVADLTGRLADLTGRLASSLAEVKSMSAHLKKYTNRKSNNEYYHRNSDEINERRREKYKEGLIQCNFCAEQKNTSIEYTDLNGVTSNICRVCYENVTKNKVRKEKVWSDYIDKHFGTEYLLSNDKSLSSQGGCRRERPDKLYSSPNVVMVCECDEYEHLYRNGTYMCEEKRISDIYDDESICGKIMPVIRYNPDTYKKPKGYKNLKQSDRLELMVDAMKFITANLETVMKSPVHVFYIGYSPTNPKICQTIPYTMLYDKIDLQKMLNDK